MDKEFRPTYLYIKQHSITGKLYFGKTIGSAYHLLKKYKGGGDYWTRHLKKHGNQIETVWYCLFTEKDELVKFARMCSEQWNIVESKEWANKKVEDGLSGGTLPGNKYTNRKSSGPLTEKRKANISKALTGKTYGPWSPEAIANHRDARIARRETGKSNKNKGIKVGPQKIVKCPYCPIKGGESIMKRWHFNNCSKRKEVRVQ